MATLNATTKFELDGTFLGSGALVNPTIALAIQMPQTWANGTGNNQANQFWQKSTTANAGTDTYELDDDSLTDDFGTALTFSTVKAIILRNTSTATGDQLVVGGDFMTGAVGGVQNVDPGGILYRTSPIDPWTVSAGSTDTLTVASGANVVTYELILIGTV